jgi:microcin C transport system substrate-binding protein
VLIEGPRQVRFDFKNNPTAPWRWTWRRCGAARTLVEDPRLRQRRRLRTAAGQRPVRVSKVDAGRSISFQRDPDWWGKDLPVSAACTTSTR